MLDFVKICERCPKKDVLEIYPDFIVRKSHDLMIRGRDFYAVWDAETHFWSTDEDDAIRLIDAEVAKRVGQREKTYEGRVKGLYLKTSRSGLIKKWHSYVQHDMRDNYKALDKTLIFANTKTKKTDYASKRLSYVLEKGDHSAWDELMGTLYSKEERAKLEWAIGAIITGDSKKLQKFLVLYGDRGTGKGTYISIVEQLFEGYCSSFEAKALGSANSAFALEPFKDNPLVAIQHDGILSKIEDNTRLNSLISHESMVVNEKFKSAYVTKFNSFLIIGTNSPVRITDSKSGILRRLIDVTPTGTTIPEEKYFQLMETVKFQLGAIAYHCKEVYLKMGQYFYNKYVPKTMLWETNDFYNFMEEQYDLIKEKDGISQQAAWALYKEYCEEARVPYPFSLKVFKSELRSYFKKYNDRVRLPDGTQVRSYYSGFKIEKFDYVSLRNDEDDHAGYVIDFSCTESLFDSLYADCPAQYANKDEKPLKAWADVKTTLKDLDTKRVHYIRTPIELICIDFDLKDETGKKSFTKNLEAASKWPPTYAELSKSGSAIHLYYIYNGDPTMLQRVYDEDIEIKVNVGLSSFRRKVTKCNNLPIATISSKLPIKEAKKTVGEKSIKDAKHLRNLILKALRKEVEPGYTVTCINFIEHVLDDAYDNGLYYDVTDMRPDILAFALGSTHHPDECAKKVARMKFCSEKPSDPVEVDSSELVFFDVEVFPNLFVIVWKAENKDPVIMVNPKAEEVERLMDFKLVGFNNRRYDNHILWGAMMGYNNEELYRLSQRIINKSPNAFFREAYNVSYADIYEFSSKKQSLKKWEIELGIDHKELGFKWDEPVPEKDWNKVTEYCVYDVLATEATFKNRKQDFIAREMLADLSGLKVNDTTRMHITKIIFGSEKKPGLVYTDLSEMFPGYSFDGYKSEYHGEDPGEGGYVYAEPKMYTSVALLDIASMHPTSIIRLDLFGEHTKKYEDILKARLAIKHGEFDNARKLFDGKLSKYLENEEQADDLAYALKIIINSTYGYTTATFDNPFKDVRNKDNIVAKRGALFMVNLKEEVQKRGFTVAHIKTDSIKIPDATPEIISFVMEYGKKYGYTFEHEATYEKMCLVNDAVYVAKYATPEYCEKLYNYIPSDNRKHGGKWTATGTQFKTPYVFKTLFSKEPIIFDDMCETKSVTTALYLDMREGLELLTPAEEKELTVLDKAYHGDDSTIVQACKRYGYTPEEFGARYSELCRKEEASHNYVFVGRVGRFCPMLPGCGAGYLMREKDGKFNAATGTKGYLWLEADTVKTLKLEDKIDKSYYRSLVDDAISTISQYGDFEWFVS